MKSRCHYDQRVFRQLDIYYLYTKYFPFNAQQNIYERHNFGVRIVKIG